MFCNVTIGMNKLQWDLTCGINHPEHVLTPSLHAAHGKARAFRHAHVQTT